VRGVGQNADTCRQRGWVKDLEDVFKLVPMFIFPVYFVDFSMGDAKL